MSACRSYNLFSVGFFTFNFNVDNVNSFQVFLTLSEENESAGQQSMEDISQMVREKLTSSSPQHSASPVNSYAQNGEVADDKREGFALEAVEVRYV